MLFRLFSLVMCFPAILIAFENEDLEKEIQKAKEVYAEDVEKARTILLEKLELQIKKYAKTGNLELVQKLVADKKEFETNDSRVPVSAEFKSDVSEYQQKIKKVKDTLLGAYSKGIKEYTKKLELDKAMVLKLEMEDFIKDKKGADSKKEKPIAKKENKEIKGVNGTRKSFICFNDKSTYLAWAPFKIEAAVLPKINNNKQADSCTFEVVNGLADKNLISLKVVERGFQTYVFVNKNSQLVAAGFQSQKEFGENATFKLTKGLASEKGVSLESYSRENFFVRKKGSDFFLDENDGTNDFSKDATFLMRDGLLKGKP